MCNCWYWQKIIASRVIQERQKKEIICQNEKKNSPGKKILEKYLIEGESNTYEFSNPI